MSSRPTGLESTSHWLAALALGAALLPFLAATGQPVWTDDVWWHLALGEAYAEQGPLLDGDPMLFAAEGPPIPAAWLADLGLHGVASGFGLQGLRVVHVALAGGILALAFGAIRRVGSHGAIAATGTLAFLALSAYRIVQLRPHLVSLGLALALVGWVLMPTRAPSWRRIAGGAAMMAIWANLHASFLLGPILVAAALAGALAGQLFGLGDDAGDRRIRIQRLAALLILGSLATLANPGFLTPHLAYFAANADTLSIGRVSDEWSGLEVWRWPQPGLPPSRLEFLVYWTLAISTLVTLGLATLRRHARWDPALGALALAGLVAPLFAVRFLWLGILPILWLASRAALAPRAPRLWLGLGCSALGLSAGFFAVGPWSSMNRGLVATHYAQPYAAGKYHTPAVWMLREAGLEGRMFQEYAHGGFLGYALAPRIQMFINGSLNVPDEILRANRSIRMHRGLTDDQSFLELLDALELDLFFGIRLPLARHGARPWFYTSKHLEGAPGWIPIFRNLDTVIYLRTHERNRDNLTRVERYYATRGIPFDPQRGVELQAILSSRNPQWATEAGAVPVHLPQLTQSARGIDAGERSAARDQLAALFAALGDCTRAMAYDRQALREAPERVATRRRHVWCLLQERRFEEARREASWLREAATRDPISAGILAASEAANGDNADTRARLAMLPVFDEIQGAWLHTGIVGARALPLR